MKAKINAVWKKMMLISQGVIIVASIIIFTLTGTETQVSHTFGETFRYLGHIDYLGSINENLSTLRLGSHVQFTILRKANPIQDTKLIICAVKPLALAMGI